MRQTIRQKLNCILLIDDNEPTNVLHQLIIEESGVAKQVVATESAKEALSYLKECSREGNSDVPEPDLIFLDINMPLMDGFEFLEEYRKERIPHNKRKIVMLTTSLNPEEENKANNISIVAGYKNKPLTEEALAEIINQYF